ncbi:MAG: HAMP domain-containing histidine kinase [Candidatus Obscuribacterales bacterium]|nr:HAMP domain-containing histidine kinase [Candidatus Obscuribacterales bacterium]
MKLLHKGLLLVSVPLAFEIFFAFGFGSLLWRSTQRLQAEIHAKEVIAKIERIHVLLSESSILVALRRESKSNESENRLNDIWKDIDKNYLALSDSLQGKAFDHPLKGIGRQISFFRYVQRMAWNAAPTSGPEPSSSTDEASNPVNTMISTALVNQIKKRHRNESTSPVDQLIRLELRTVQQGTSLHREISNEFRYFMLFGVIGDILLVALLALFFGQSIERRLQNLMETTRRLAKDDNLLPAMQGDDEFAKLDVLLNNTASTIIETRRFKRQLLGVVCHEIKAPLSAVQILLSLVSNDRAEIQPSALRLLERASKSCNRLQLMVAELLDMESMNADKVKLNRVEASPDEMMNTAVEMLRAFAQDQQVTIVIDCDTQSVALVDPDRMIQVLVNLLSNAIKFSPPGSTVTITARQTSDELTFAVIDQGPGIPKDLHDSLFEVFTQGKQSGSSKIKGTGMGLSICKGIVEAHGGRIGIISEEGEGATIELVVPTTAAVTATRTKADSEAHRPAKQGLFRIRHKGLVLIGLPLVTQMVFLGALCLVLQDANLQLSKQSKARKIISGMKAVVEDAADSAIIVMLGRGHPEQEQLVREQEIRIRTKLDNLKALATADTDRTTSSSSIAQTVEKITESHRTILEESKKRALTPTTAGEKLVSDYLTSWNSLTKEVEELAAREENLEATDTKVLKDIGNNLGILLLVGLTVNVLSALGLTWFVSKNIVRRIDQVRQNAERILRREPLLPPVNGLDEIAHLDRSFHDAATAIKQEQELKQKLVAIASHELRSPLTAITLSLGILSSGEYGELSEKNAQRIARAEAGAERLIALINDILDIEKMEAGKFELVKQRLQIREVVSRAIECIRPIAEKKAITIENEAQAAEVEADPERLLQVLINLLTNAIKFSPAGQTVRATTCAIERAEVIVRIEDRGSGIDEDIRDRIFEQFVTKADRDNPEGTGLGLPICKAIVEQHGGSIGCEAIDGGGTAFWFSIPLAKAGIADQASPAELPLEQ